MNAYLKIIRPKNLLIIGITQFLLYYIVIIPYIANPILDLTLFILLVVDTLLIAAGGFLINDIFDYESDQINKPEKTYIPSLISLKNAKIVYISITIIGFLLALYIAFRIDNLGQIVIYPAAVVMLYAYSAKFKNTIIWGNIIVSIFISLVAGIVFFAERNEISQLASQDTKVLIFEIFIFYMLFSFLINLAREIVKDIEDAEGDKKLNISTLPIKYGDQFAIKVAMGIFMLLILLLAIWMMISNIEFSFRATFFIILFIIAPLGWIIQKLKTAKLKRDYSRISQIIKLVMLAGLGSLMLIS